MLCYLHSDTLVGNRKYEQLVSELLAIMSPVLLVCSRQKGSITIILATVLGIMYYNNSYNNNDNNSDDNDDDDDIDDDNDDDIDEDDDDDDDDDDGDDDDDDRNKRRRGGEKDDDHVIKERDIAVDRMTS
ncbi:hypothetical protein PoB_005616500 [Plakobranchus ocellatus]|uniref:Uncharacterized protein n=1 Tax=Plakobranchus ocellatus TaxID=259542 RepID=A0AAV4CDC8_9GAST|nr:hypothetical protein PoB_005616500 [Plakobranchus ocellatus]